MRQHTWLLKLLSGAVILLSTIGMLGIATGGTAMAATAQTHLIPSSSTQTTSDSNAQTPTGQDLMHWQDLIQENCNTNAAVAEGHQRMSATDIVKSIGPFPFWSPVMAAITLYNLDHTTAVPIKDSTGTTLGTVTLYHSDTCTGSYAIVSTTPTGTTSNMQLLGVQMTDSQGNLYGSPQPRVMDTQVYSALLPDMLVQQSPTLCATGAIQEGSTFFTATTCASTGTTP